MDAKAYAIVMTLAFLFQTIFSILAVTRKEKRS